jgi:hypothetical protein
VALFLFVIFCCLIPTIEANRFDGILAPGRTKTGDAAESSRLY